MKTQQEILWAKRERALSAKINRQRKVINSQIEIIKKLQDKLDEKK